MREMIKLARFSCHYGHDWVTAVQEIEKQKKTTNNNKLLQQLRATNLICQFVILTSSQHSRQQEWCGSSSKSNRLRYTDFSVQGVAYMKLRFLNHTKSSGSTQASTYPSLITTQKRPHKRYLSKMVFCYCKICKWESPWNTLECTSRGTKCRSMQG